MQKFSSIWPYLRPLTASGCCRSGGGWGEDRCSSIRSCMAASPGLCALRSCRCSRRCRTALTIRTSRCIWLRLRMSSTATGTMCGRSCSMSSLPRQAAAFLALPAAGTGAQRRHRARAAAAARFPQSGYYGRHHEHDRRRARLCTLGAWKRQLQKTAGIGAELPAAFPVENRQKFLYTDVVTKTRKRG